MIPVFPVKPTRGRAALLMITLMFVLAQCDKNPILPSGLPTQWAFETLVVDIDTMAVHQVVRVPEHGSSRTLYAGMVDSIQTVKAGLLLKWAAFDSAATDSALDAILANFASAELRLFRRTFGADSFPDQGATFTVSLIEYADTLWTDRDTSLTLTDFTAATRLIGDSSMVVRSVEVYKNFYETTVDSVEYLPLRIDKQTLLDWSDGNLVNNGLLVSKSGSDAATVFHSSDALRSPYLALAYRDTTAATLKTAYFRVYEDISVYPALPGHDVSETGAIIQLGHSTGLVSRIDYVSHLELDSTQAIAGARLVLHKNEVLSHIKGDELHLSVLRRLEAWDKGDQTDAFRDIIFKRDDDRLVIDLGLSPNTHLRDYIVDYINGRPNYGFELVVRPDNYDPDQLVFWGPAAPDTLLRPRLELLLSDPYEEAGQ